MIRSTYKALVIFCLSSLAVACGGGGGNGGSANSPTNPINQAPVQAVQPAQQNPMGQAEANPDVAPLTVALKPAKPQAASPSHRPDNEEGTQISQTWSGESLSKVRGGDFSYPKEAVFTYNLESNPKAVSENDPNLIKKEVVYVELKQGVNQDSQAGPNYVLNLLDENVYYGFYRDSADMNHVENIYVYGFKKEAENRDNLQQLSANYEGKFLFATATNPNVPLTGKATLNYTAGKATGAIHDRDSDEKLFEIKVNDTPNQAVISPVVTRLPASFIDLDTRDNSPDRIAMDLHFIKGKKDANQYIVGKGGNEKYWGVLGLEKKENQASQ